MTTASRPADGEAGVMAGRLLGVVSALCLELGTVRRGGERITLEARLDRDLGLDSLARAELLLRIEREFDVNLPDRALGAATPAALLRLVLGARGRTGLTAQGVTPFAGLPTVSELPAEATTLTGVLDWHSCRNGERTHLYLYRDDGRTQTLSYAQLHEGARQVAAGLQGFGVEPGATVALMLPTGRDYFQAFLGTLYAGAVPVPIYPPARPSQIEEHMRRHGRILGNAGARLLLTVPEARRVAHLLRAEAPALGEILSVAQVVAQARGRAARGAPASVDGDTLALLQYTSGSTGDPKGVTLSHANLMANIRAMGERLEARPEDVFVSWLPLYHDMGLIGAWLGSMYYAVPLVLMSPRRFLARPLEWLHAIHRHRGTISGGPNFGYELCLRALEPARLEGLDLSCWRVAFNGAEPVSPQTLERFARELAPFGFRRSALMPVYGLAEAAVGLTLPRPGSGPALDRVTREAFEIRRQAQVAPAHADDALVFVGCGEPLPGYQVRVVARDGRECPERREGEIEFRGPSATAGYYRNPEGTRGLFHHGWLVTGDRGYIAGGQIFVTGRSKDVIVRGGRNIYPYELEEGVGRVPGVRRGGVAAFGARQEPAGAERLVVVAETRERESPVRERLCRDIRARVLDVAGVPADDVRLVPPHGVLKTSSGKIRRGAMAELYRRGRLQRGSRAVWRQAVRLVLESAHRRSLRRVRHLLELAYAGWAWTIFGVVGALVWLAVVALPGARSRWIAARVGTVVAAALSAIQVEVRGLEHLPAHGHWVLVANHASYLDALVLTRAIPRRLRYLAKRELARQPAVDRLLRRLGVVYVERFDPAAAAQDAGRVAAVVAAGGPVACFAEGTFDRDPGLRPFHLGAFVAAAQAGVSVVPVALQGTRSLMRGSEWFPRHGRARVTIGAPIAPDGNDWDAALRLRDRARTFILAECGEPDAVR